MRKFTKIYFSTLLWVKSLIILFLSFSKKSSYQLDVVYSYILIMLSISNQYKTFEHTSNNTPFEQSSIASPFKLGFFHLLLHSSTHLT